jgi:hypothetical protein
MYLNCKANTGFGKVLPLPVIYSKAKAKKKKKRNDNLLICCNAFKEISAYLFRNRCSNGIIYGQDRIL